MSEKANRNETREGIQTQIDHSIRAYDGAKLTWHRVRKPGEISILPLVHRKDRKGNTPAMTQTVTRSQQTSREIAALFKAKNTLLWVTTREEARAEAGIQEAAIAAKFTPRIWDCATGVQTLTGEFEGTADIDETLTTIAARATAKGSDRGVWILRDAHDWLAGPIGTRTRRQLRNLARKLQTTDESRAQSIVILTPSTEIPPELANHTVAIDWPLPDRSEIAQIFDDAMEILPPNLRPASNGTRDAAIDAAIGLSGEEATSCYAKSLVTLRRIDPRLVNNEKKKIITRERVLEWHDPIPGGLAAVGGLNELKRWLAPRKLAYSQAARDYGLPAPRGVFLVGVSGCGKTLIGKAIATYFECPFLKLDLGALKGKFVGESEGNIRRAKRVVEAIGRCVVLIDEIEKFITTGDSAADGGVSSDQLGSLLIWMQERTSEVFFVATANDVSRLPPELLRKGRFDEIFAIDLPSETERGEILLAALREHNRGEAIDAAGIAAIAAATADFTGAEVASLVPEAMYAAFADGAREIGTLDLIAAARRIVPLAKTAVEKIAAFRAWAAARARPATTVEPMEPTKSAARRNLDME